MFTIGELAKRAGVSADAVRLYERQGLIAAAGKTTSGYRLYGDDALRRLVFIRHAQRCRFSLGEIRELLRVPDGQRTTAAEAYHLAVEKKADVDNTIVALQAMSEALSILIAAGDGRGAMHSHVGTEESPLLKALETYISRSTGATPVPNAGDANTKPCGHAKRR